MRQEIEYVLPKIISSSSLKLIALLAMTIDHIGAFLLINCEMSLLSIGGMNFRVDTLARCIGRIAFPIYAF